MKIYIVRHGETKWNEEGRMQGVQNSDLTEIGIDEAKKLGDRLKNTEFTKVWTSPLGRCLETTSHIVGDRDLEVEILEDLHEFNFGVFEGKPVDVLEEKYPEENYNLWNRPEKYEGNGGENFEEFFERVEKGFNRIIEEGQGGNVLVITHGIYISALLAHLRNRNVSEIWEVPIVDNTSLNIIKVIDGTPKIVSKNDTDHLK